ncbi:MAG TPA: glycosyltransferase, partial [Longimicrobium sp.]|nr:glycosyltransferase [Longimicrobium sp.]
MPKIPSTPRAMLVTGQITDGFMRDDLRILHRQLQVVPHEHAALPAPGGGVVGRGVRVALNFAAFLYRLVRHDARVVVFWFASTWYAPLMALLARGLGRRVVVVTGGMDAVYVPEIDWGLMKRPAHRRSFGVLMRVADAVLPFSEASAATIRERYRPRRLRTVHPAVDTRFFVPGAGTREARVVTCCYEYGAGNIVQKGLDGFVETARRLPGVPFVLVGDPVDDAARALAAQAPPNVAFVPRIPGRAAYRDFLAGSSVYLQLSAHEGFGVSVAEAMACGCVPVVSDRFSLPEVVGDAGCVVPFGDAAAAAEAVRGALCPAPGMRAAARARVEERFGRERRAAALGEELARLVPELRSPPLRVELGCGSTGVAGAVGVDARLTVQTAAVCDVQHSCFRSGIADEVYSFCVLEHLDDPYRLMDEVARILKPGGRAYLRVPNLGTFSSHLDTTHRFLADLSIWRGIMNGYFEKVTVVPEGTKYRDNPL